MSFFIIEKIKKYRKCPALIILPSVQTNFVDHLGAVKVGPPGLCRGRDADDSVRHATRRLCVQEEERHGWFRQAAVDIGQSRYLISSFLIGLLFCPKY